MRKLLVLLSASLVAFSSQTFSAIVISEFMAENDGFTHDQDGDSPDWIELHNNSLAAVNLAGWHLTDTPTNLSKWTFPAVDIPSGGFLLVFASGKNRAVSGAELHANFQLENSGGYLALVEPDGATIATAFANYPAQHRNVSFGPGLSNGPPVTLLAANAPAAWFIPTNDVLGTSWTASGFDASTWALTNTPLRYDVTLDSGALKIDVNDRENDNATNTQAGFSSFVIAGTTTPQSTPITRNFGPVSMTVSSVPSGINYDDRLRGAPANGGSLTTEDIYRDFIFSAYNAVLTNGLDVLIAGLNAGQLFQVTVWSFDSGSGTGNRISDWSANGVLVTNNYSFIGSTLPADDNANKIVFNATANGSGQILISARRDTTSLANQPAVFLNALQLVPIPAIPATNGNVAALAGKNPGLYSRQSFTVADSNAFNQLTLRMRSDDAFVAYLNGTEVARRRAPITTTWDSTATTTNSASVFEDVVLPGAASLLVDGTNVLSVHGLNIAASDNDFFIEPQLLATLASATSGNYLASPSPGALNNAGYLGVVADTKFSVDRGFYETPFSLSITTATAGAEIRYTTNGSPPSPTNGFLFSSPISIAGLSFIRAAAFLPDWISSGIDTHTYVFLRDTLRQSNNIPGYPTIWAQGSYPADYEMDSNIVNHPFYGQTLSNDLRSIPVLSIVTEFDGLWGPVRGIYNHATSTHDLDLGQDWERAASAELILPTGGNGTNGRTAFAVNCGVRMQGNASRDNARTPKHSFRLLFKSQYGPSRLDYDWFPGPVEEFDNIVLRAVGFVDAWPSRYADAAFYTNATTGEVYRGARYRPETGTYLRDVFVKDSHDDMGWLASRGDWVHLYINGLYWGLYNPCERIDSAFMARHIGGWEQDWDVLVGDDALFNAAMADGSKNDWNVLMSLLNSGVTSEAAYASVTNLVDIESLIDYFLLHIYVEAEDWPNHNWYAAHRRANSTNGLPATKWQFFTWDQEVSLDRNVRRDRSGVANADTPANIYSRLRAWPEFNRQFGDRVQKHLFNGGALTPSNNVARFAERAAAITNALVGESARWGDAREFTIGANPGTGQTFTRDEWWKLELSRLWTNLFPALHDINIARLRAAGLYPQLAAPLFSQFGGAVSNGFALVITHTNASGTIYFTTDGSDPRTYGSGAVAGSAVAYSTPVPINSPTVVRARVLNGVTWSALIETVFYPPQDYSRLVLTEIMYHPPVFSAIDGDEFEFVELKNAGTNTLNLSGLTFSGITFTFTNGTTLAPGQFFVLVRNPATFAFKYPAVAVNGSYIGSLNNAGESLTLSHALGGTIFSVTYDDVAPWPVTPDDWGFSLVNNGLTQAPDDGYKWRASTFTGGSPGADDPAPTIEPVFINEILTHTDLPFVDRIELFNPSGANIIVGGWFLTDNPAVPKKFRIPDGTFIPGGGFLTFDESQFNATPGTNGSFSLSSSGESVYLFSGDVNTNLTGYSHGLVFGAAANGVSFGRYLNSVLEEQFPAQISQTFDTDNSGPRVGPVVINEIHYHPATNGDEFVELKNITATNVTLFDPLNPANTWKVNGLSFTFPTNVTLAPDGLLLLVATNPAAFIAKYSVPPGVIVLGPFTGGLQDNGERLELTRPDAPNTNAVPHIVVDSVRYNDKLPWPPGADGSGPSLQRKFVAQYGDDPINWQAAAITPGVENAEVDSDGDGMPDSWEILHGALVNAPDAHDDADSDGHTNYQEYLAGTHPQNPASRLRVERIEALGDGVHFEFIAASNRTFTVQFKRDLDDGWSVLTNISAAPQTRLIDITVPRTNTVQFYRVGAP